MKRTHIIDQNIVVIQKNIRINQKLREVMIIWDCLTNQEKVNIKVTDYQKKKLKKYHLVQVENYLMYLKIHSKRQKRVKN